MIKKNLEGGGAGVIIVGVIVIIIIALIIILWPKDELEDCEQDDTTEK